MGNELLFVYGTLLTADNEYGLFLENNCRFYKQGKFKGRLYDIGHYPGAITDNTSCTYVYGSIYEIINADEVFKILDEYEGIADNEPLPHEYIRQKIKIETNDDFIICWTYLYNWPVNHFKEIVSGDYLQHSRDK